MRATTHLARRICRSSWTNNAELFIKEKDRLDNAPGLLWSFATQEPGWEVLKHCSFLGKAKRKHMPAAKERLKKAGFRPPSEKISLSSMTPCSCGEASGGGMEEREPAALPPGADARLGLSLGRFFPSRRRVLLTIGRGWRIIKAECLPRRKERTNDG